MKTPASLILSTLVLAACGGGGEDNPDPAPVAAAPAASAPAATPPAQSAPPSQPQAPTTAPNPGGSVTPSPAPIAPSRPDPDRPAQVPAPAPAPSPVVVAPPVANPPPSAPVEPPPSSPVVRTEMSCQDSLDGTGPIWQLAFEVNTTEYPWKNFWAYGDRSGYFETDPVGDIVNKRGRAAVPPPTRGINAQPEYWATVLGDPNDPNGITTVTIGSMYYPHSYIYTLERGRVLRALRPASNLTPGTVCYAVS